MTDAARHGTDAPLIECLLIVDAQNDFMPGGALAVADGDTIVAVANRLSRRAKHVLATQDWHPAGHASFASAHPGYAPGDTIEIDGETQLLWPDHCVQDTWGAAFHAGLDVSRVSAVVHKGVDRDIDSYSAFFDNAHKRDTGLDQILRARSVRRIHIVGLATDYCVLWSALDALRLGFEVRVVSDGVRAVEVNPGDSERALATMREKGAIVQSCAEILDAEPAC